MKNNTFIIWLFQCSFLCCLAITGNAQLIPASDSIPKKLPGNDWIEYMAGYINLKLTLASENEALSVTTPGANYYLMPNAKTITRLGFSYKFLSFAYSYNARFLPGNDDDDIRGKTRGNGYNLNFNFSKWQQELAYSKTKGFYLENTSENDPNWQEGDPYIQLPELQYETFEGITAYKFNPNYSLNAVATQSERQLKSAGSFMPALFYRYYIVDNKVPLTGSNSSQKSNNFEMLLGIGYYHTFVMKKSFYLSLGATPSYGFISTNLKTRLPTETLEDKSSHGILRWDVRAGIGYNGERFYAGTFLRGFGSSYSQAQSTVVNSDARASLKFFIGYRLNAPQFLKRNVEKAESLLPH